MHGSSDGRLGSTLHVQVKSWRGTRGGGNGCHCCAVCARATVLAVCCVPVSAVPAVVRAVTVLPQRHSILCNPSSIATLHPQQTCKPSSTTTAAPHHQSSRRHPFSCHHPATCWALAACHARTQSLLLRKRGWLGVPSSDWKWGEGTGGNVWAP